jgi:tRNA-specific 2-thiouridylase
MNKVLVGLSGGVDSAVAALVLKAAGWEVSAAYIKTWSNEYDLFADCPSAEDIHYAKAVSEHLGIDFEVVNLVETYRQKVVQYLIEGYRAGITPNPDVMCNREVKFGAFRDYALQNGFAYVGTGHYCQRIELPDGKAGLQEGIDPNKDQSYFLAMMRPDQVACARFPIGGITKPEVRALARKHGLPNAERKDSQGICFLGKVRINDFLAQYIPNRPGPILNLQNQIIGEHLGLHRYTIGQRKGIGIPSNCDHEAYVVVAKDLESNTLRVAFDHNTTPGLYCNHVDVHGLSAITEAFWDQPFSHCRVRYRDPRVEVSRFEPIEPGRYRLHFATPQRALAPGQVMAFHEGPRLLGGGIMIPPPFTEAAS